MKKTVVINIVGLTERLIGTHTPNIVTFLNQGQLTYIKPVVPAVTCTAQSTYLTGKWPSEHGIVGNGWYFKEECEVKFWRQSNKLVQSEKIWDELKALDKDFTCANLFWWYNMYSSADYGVTPRPNYLADGRKIPDIYSYPANLRNHLQEELGTFPLFKFWGPMTSIASSKWIADAAVLTDQKYDPTLSLIYLPHLDYNLQRYGNDLKIIDKDLKEIDTVVGELITYYKNKDSNIILLSEYGITDVDLPIHINRILRKEGYLAIREERGLELLDAGMSTAFGVADHQIAHIYLNDPSVQNKIKNLFLNTKGVQAVLTGEEIKTYHLDHDRCGDLVVIAAQNAWFTYYFWEDDKKAPDFARMVDIHKKPGYDPVEMLLNANDLFVKPKILLKLLKKKLGFRTVMNVIPLDANLIKGSHGTVPTSPLDYPVLISDHLTIKDAKNTVEAIEVYRIIKDQVISS
ncbi:alkaline phosphatase family protein [Aquimarina sp. ERC-38]|uniref:alkaline phosphatase family protein n=1 Tax=Aquimarina sp. ERC-38 TaxID=2949996 RepID=UPI0022455C71|nr:nucleotide pyrophosphatase/phosphodiesterase family protein [Aquimarina sp. ERC-38]UZO80575.1 alkaline phosphatase family protein [Aquimarina sp. ERC-38]